MALSLVVESCTGESRREARALASTEASSFLGAASQVGSQVTTDGVGAAGTTCDGTRDRSQGRSCQAPAANSTRTYRPLWSPGCRGGAAPSAAWCRNRTAQHQQAGHRGRQSASPHPAVLQPPRRRWALVPRSRRAGCPANTRSRRRPSRRRECRPSCGCRPRRESGGNPVGSVVTEMPQRVAARWGGLQCHAGAGCQLVERQTTPGGGT